MDRFLIRTNEGSGIRKLKANAGAGKQRTLGSLAKVVILPKGVTNRVFSNEFLSSLKMVLDCASSSEEQLIEAIRQLSSLVITEDHLLQTQIGRSVRRLSKHSGSAEVRRLAGGLLNSWRDSVAFERGRKEGPRPARQPPAALTSSGHGFAPKSGERPEGGGGHAELGAGLRDTGAVPEALRSRVRSLLSAALNPSEGQDVASEAGPSPSGPSPHLTGLATEIECCLHGVLSSDPKSYRRRAREVAAALRKNPSLRGKTIAGWVGAELLVSLGEDASQEFEPDGAAAAGSPSPESAA
uniref:TFIIS N-terminal domain-containing protein n=1 Tax=Tetraselmis sp. GSL018 TaxID=582737 RepID=A0A061RIX8_9CHLO|mmetsp:Transcript_31096/g.73917  ORF Transcript_31096/g.73917 Transcript_31096/m.73917 type:complete len:297 (-) Transcript_31096:459-1349(-)